MSRARATFRLGNPHTGKQVATLTTFGKSFKQAAARGRKIVRNVADGYTKDGIFRPIRWAPDYSRARGGDLGPAMQRAARQVRRKIKSRATAARKRRNPKRRTSKMPPALARYWRTHRRGKSSRRKK